MQLCWLHAHSAYVSIIAATEKKGCNCRPNKNVSTLWKSILMPYIEWNEHLEAYSNFIAWFIKCKVNIFDDSMALVKTLRRTHTHIHTSSFKKVPCCLLSGVSSEELCRCFSDVLKMLPRTDSVAFKNSGSVPSEPSNPFKRAFTQGHITQYLSECHHRLLFNCGPVFSGLEKKRCVM